MKDIKEELETMLKNQANYLEGLSNTEDTKTAFIEMLSEEEILKSVGKEWLKKKSESGSFMVPVIRKSFPNIIKADLVKEWPMGNHRYRLIEAHGKEFVASYDIWLRQFDTDSVEGVVYGNRDEDYDIKGIKVKQYMLERLES